MQVASAQKEIESSLPAKAIEFLRSRGNAKKTFSCKEHTERDKKGSTQSALTAESLTPPERLGHSSAALDPTVSIPSKGKAAGGDSLAKAGQVRLTTSMASFQDTHNTCDIPGCFPRPHNAAGVVWACILRSGV